MLRYLDNYLDINPLYNILQILHGEIPRSQIFDSFLRIADCTEASVQVNLDLVFWSDLQLLLLSKFKLA